MPNQSPALKGDAIKRLANRWKKYALREKKLGEASAQGTENYYRSYGAWLAYRECVRELERMAEEGR